MFGPGLAGTAAFAVGAGHVAMYQIRHRGERGRVPALVGLIIGYAMATWALVESLRYIPAIAKLFRLLRPTRGSIAGARLAPPRP